MILETAALIMAITDDLTKNKTHHLQCNALQPRIHTGIKRKCNCEQLFATNVPNVHPVYKRLRSKASKGRFPNGNPNIKNNHP